MSDVLGLVASIAICFAAAAVGGYATSRSLRDWYLTLPKPSWSPPNQVFGPVWTVLYATMGVATWLVWRVREDRDVSIALASFGAQLALNVLWSVVFFGARRPAAGVVVIVLLWVAILATIIAFAPHSLLAALLLVPYLAWVTFASLLNLAIARRVAIASR